MVACASRNNAPSQSTLSDEHTGIKGFHCIHQSQYGSLAQVIASARSIGTDGTDGDMV